MLKNNLLIFLIMFAAFTFTACGDNSDDTSSPAVIYATGDTGPSGVGRVFYITDGGLHGLEAAPSGWNGTAVDPTSSWSNIDATEIGSAAQGTAIGTGLSNSNAIIAQAGHNASAAKMCRDYAGGGLTDWFLPSQDELIKLFEQRAVAGGIEADALYWSSSERSGDGERAYALDTNGAAYDGKSSLNYVRPIRAF
ncbi:MAG: DUF1566 domain-containing protein [Spirochaetes bacterium]|nr:DUF1566 domain-containing protein [Spirochaetota bacterium]